ncbi:olfactory receptor 52K2-like [Aquarana catesbeiana]|uniref:olfactory receptor 52K2-like n=1 Tax=Aquarana catesbeiana TaxID=8400 RepID=UPI003CC9AE88
MPGANSSNQFPTHFILLGFPGLERSYFYIAFMFTIVYVTSVIGNFTLLFIIKIDRSLHEPMYFFLCMLSAIDLVLFNSTTPKMLGILWFGIHEIYFEACLTQMFFLHTFIATESALLLAMSFDRYIAICQPLRYNSILTKLLITNIGLLAIGRAVALTISLPFLMKRLPFCSTNVIHHSYCEHMAVVRLACTDTTFNSIYGLAVAMVIVGLDLSLIILSYVLILQAVFRLDSTEARYKALGTCASHICAILLLYVPIVVSSVVYRLGKDVPIHIHILLANVHLVLPPLINPIVYGLRTKQIRNRIKSIIKVDFMCFIRVRAEEIAIKTMQVPKWDQN